MYSIVWSWLREALCVVRLNKVTATKLFANFKQHLKTYSFIRSYYETQKLHPKVRAVDFERCPFTMLRHLINCRILIFIIIICPLHYSSIGQIIKPVCLCVSQSVSLSQNELNALQITILHRSSPNLPPT